MSSAFAKLAQNGKGAAARLNAKHKALMCNKSFPMMRRLFDAVVRPTVSYGCEVWAPACSQPLSPELKDMLGIQISFFRQLCHLKRSVTPNIIFREFSEGPWLEKWWSFLLGFMRRLSLLPEGSLHLDILRDNIADAKGPLPCANWAQGIDRQFASLGIASPFVSSGIGALDSHGLLSRMAQGRQRVWEGLHVSPRTAPSKGAKLCTYHNWFGRPDKVRCEPYYELPMGIARLRALVQFRVGSHALPVEQGRYARPALPRHLRRCNLCSTQALGDELHYVFDCPHFSDIRSQYPALYQDADGCMRLFVWHIDQKAVSHCLTAILNKAQDMNTDSSS